MTQLYGKSRLEPIGKPYASDNTYKGHYFLQYTPEDASHNKKNHYADNYYIQGVHARCINRAHRHGQENCKRNQ